MRTMAATTRALMVNRNLSTTHSRENR